MNFALIENQEKEPEEMALKSNKRYKAGADCRGFTLMELLITMAIIAIVASMAVPSFQRIAINNNLKTAARDMASDFALYKERAIAESCMYKIVVDVANRSYDIQQCGATGSVCAGYNSIQVKNLTQYAADINFSGAAPANYVFQTRGTVNMGAIGLTNSRGSTAAININITGRTNVQFNLQ
jgi:prepilin-type N-terminal cleavage/methylation domain-containing protein